MPGCWSASRPIGTGRRSRNWCAATGRSCSPPASGGWPTGTVSGRLARARDLLHSRLTRRGLAVTAAATAAVLAERAAPAALAETTCKAAVLIAAGKAAADVASPAVAGLTEGVLQAM